MIKKVVVGLLSIGVLYSCKGKVDSKISVKFKDEYILKDSIEFDNTLIGGLSGIDYDGKNYYMVIDDSKDPRIVKATIRFQEDTIQKIDFNKVIKLADSSDFYKNNVLDLESVIFDANKNEFHLASEGFIKKGKVPAIFKTDAEGSFKKSFELPSYFTTTAKHNASFESSSKSIDGKGIWVAMEGVLSVDGEHPTFTKTTSPIRITLFNNEESKATKQYVYLLDKVDKPKKGRINLNGVTAILAYNENSFLVVERAYQSGYGSYGNTVKLYKATIEDNTTNTLAINALKNKEYIPLKKELVLNFDDIKPQLTDGIIDNIEGITFGPILANGNKSLLLISDDNFQRYDAQINQFILLEIEK